MKKNRIRSGYGRQKHKKTRAFIFLILLIFISSVSIPVISHFRNRITNERREILRLWNIDDFKQVYDISKNALSGKPMDYFLLTINGFSAYQLGISQITRFNTLFYINECIISLRKALLLKEAASDGRVCYVLGKAYSYKGDEYADLAIKYLEMAQNLSYTAVDIPEFLGLAYAVCGDYRGSVEAFTQALIHSFPPSDTLLLPIARSYMALQEYNIAADYLKRCIEISQDSRSILIAQFLLAEIFIFSEDYDSAENLYVSILSDMGDNAEVHYQLGELYNLKGDTVRARSEWRIAQRQDPAHAKARARLNM